MTTTSRNKLTCECGFEGFMVLRENDQPFSALWDEYSLEGFTGNDILVTSYANFPKDLMSALQPHCPNCGQTNKLKAKNA